MGPNDNSGYQGPERRQEHRRQHVDRRLDIRFEPGKTNRRKGRGRRITDLDPWDVRED